MSILEQFENYLDYSQEGDSVLLEISKKKLLGNTDAGRLIRAKTQVRTKPASVLLLDPQKRLFMLEYNFRAYPSKEEKRHWGYVIYDMIHDDILENFCDCRDFFYRLYAPMVKNNLARWGLNNKYTMRLIKPHNKKWTVITNPTGKLFVCKHLAAMLQGYVGPDEESDVTGKDAPKVPPSISSKVSGVEKEPEAIDVSKIDKSRFRKQIEPALPKRPLAGVHIDKRFKEQIKQAKEQKKKGI